MNIIIVGCGNIGFETAKSLSDEHNILLIDIVEHQYVTDFIKGKENITFARADATDVAQVEKAINAFIDRYHRVDALVSTIGAVVEANLVDYFDEFKRNFELNFFGNLVPIKCVIGSMIEAKSGRLIILSSTTGHHSPKSLIAYTPAKWALESLCITLRSELRPYGITVDVVSPASIKNQYSTTFVNRYGVIELSSVVSKIKLILRKPKNANHFIPARYRMVHLVERMIPEFLDRRSGLKPRMKRERALKNLKVDSVLIIGASSDIGKKLAFLNAKSARKLYLIDKDYPTLQETKNYLEVVSGCEVSIAALDISDPRVVKMFADGIGGVDLLVNISWMSAIGTVNDTPLDLYKRDLDANFFGVLYLLAELFKKKNKPKKIVNVLPSVVISGRRYHSSYACTMAAFWAITKSLRRVYGNELQVMEVISSLGIPAARAPRPDGMSDGLFESKSAVDTAARKIYGAERSGKEFVVLPASARLLLVIEALIPRLFSKVYT